MNRTAFSAQDATQKELKVLHLFLLALLHMLDATQKELKGHEVAERGAAVAEGCNSERIESGERGSRGSEAAFAMQLRKN